MNTYKARGIVIRETNVGEYDKILTLLFKDIGKVSVSAKGVRKASSKRLSASSLFCYADYVINTGGKYPSIAQTDIIESFFSLTNDLDTLAYATFFVELMDKTVLEDEPVNELLLLLITSLKVLSTQKLKPQLVARIFTLKYLKYNGYEPSTKKCAICGENKAVHLFSSEGIVCEDCAHKVVHTVKVSPTTLYTIDYILCSSIDTLFNFDISANTLLELTNICHLLFETHINIKLHSYEFIQNLELY